MERGRRDGEKEGKRGSIIPIGKVKVTASILSMVVNVTSPDPSSPIESVSVQCIGLVHVHLKYLTHVYQCRNTVYKVGQEYLTSNTCVETLCTK